MGEIICRLQYQYVKSSVANGVNGLQVLDKVGQLQEAISEGATSFLTTEYKYMGIFSVSDPFSTYIR